MKKKYFIGLLFGAVLLTGCSGISSTIADMQMKSAKKVWNRRIMIRQ